MKEIEEVIKNIILEENPTADENNYKKSHLYKILLNHLQ
jgi:hypothetical protein